MKYSYSSSFFRLFIALFILLTLFSCRQNSPSFHFKNGSAKYQLKNYEGAVLDLNKAIELKPDYKEAYYERALCESELNKYPKALTDFNKVISLDPAFKDAYLNRAFYVKEKTGDFEGAVEDYQKYIGLNTAENNAFAYNNMGFAKFRMNDLDGAMKDVMTSIKLDAKNSFAYKNRALIYIAMDSISSACHDLNKAIDLGFGKTYGNEVNDLINKYCKETH